MIPKCFRKLQLLNIQSDSTSLAWLIIESFIIDPDIKYSFTLQTVQIHEKFIGQTKVTEKFIFILRNDSISSFREKSERPWGCPIFFWVLYFMRLMKLSKINSQNRDVKYANFIHCKWINYSYQSGSELRMASTAI